MNKLYLKPNLIIRKMKFRLMRIKVSKILRRILQDQIKLSVIYNIHNLAEDPLVTKINPSEEF